MSLVPNGPKPLDILFVPGQSPGGANASWSGYKPMPAVNTSIAPLTTDKARPSLTDLNGTPATTTAGLDADLLASQLFDSRAAAKMIVSSLAMHLAGDWRNKINKQVDDLLAVEEWDSTEGLLQPTSMQTFLRFVIFADVRLVPSLGMSPAGFILAAWRHDTRRLTIEFLPGDRCRLAISHVAGDDDSIVTFGGASVKARDFLQQQNFALG